MSTLQGVVPLVDLTPQLIDQLKHLHVVVSKEHAGQRVFIDVGGWDLALPEKLAQQLSEATHHNALSVIGQSSADVYVIAEYAEGRLLRRISYNRDDDGWLPSDGTMRPWEAELHFFEPLDQFTDRLSDWDDWTAEEIERARGAHASRRIEDLPRLPPAHMAGLFAVLAASGVELEKDGIQARYKEPGLLSRLFGAA